MKPVSCHVGMGRRPVGRRSPRGWLLGLLIGLSLFRGAAAETPERATETPRSPGSRPNEEAPTPPPAAVGTDRAHAFTPTSASPPTPAAAKPPPAKFRVSGLGLLNNRVARMALQKLWPEKKLPPELPASFIEDAALLLRNMQVEEGFLRAVIRVELTRADGSETNCVCAPEGEFYLPTGFGASEVHLRAERGLRYFFKDLQFEDLGPIEENQARGFFHPTDSLVPLRSERPFSPAQFDRSLRNLRLELANLGYREARVEAPRLDITPASGEVRATVRLVPGPMFRVRRLEITVRDTAESEAVRRESRTPDEPYTLLWEQDLSEALNRAEFAGGHPDTTVHFREVAREAVGDEVRVELAADVLRGPRIALGEVEFTGQKRTCEWMLRNKAELTGPWLNRLEADRARHNLSRLGIFKTVYVDYPEVTNHVRNVRYTLEEGRTIDTRLLFGYGSYDLLFGGVELDQFNLFGVGHSARLYAVQSFKSTVGRYTYSIPEFLAPDLTAFLDADALWREELSFDRQEIKLGAGLRKAFPATSQQVGARYSYEFLNADNRGGNVVKEETQVAAVILDWSIERRNNPLLPRRGYKASTAIEFAEPVFGGEARYQRLEASFSHHLPVARATYLHFGFWHGVAADVLFDDGPLPFNKRLFPGGETSIRGYQRGEASPVDADGNQLGAESAMVGNLELEQALTRAWSVVGFVDVGGVAATIEDYPFDEVLVSVGGGLRWNTPVGPLRIEYGYNLDPRPTDPTGTLHFSIGFPF